MKVERYIKKLSRSETETLITEPSLLELSFRLLWSKGMNNFEKSIKIRKAVAADVESIWIVRTAAIKSIPETYYTKNEIDIWSSTPPPENFSEVIIKLNWHVVEYQGQIIGTGFIDLVNAELGGIFIAPHFQRERIGSKILSTLEQLAINNSVNCLHLDATINAEQFYTSAGYYIIKGAKFAHVSGIYLDCLKMSKNLF